MREKVPLLAPPAMQNLGRQWLLSCEVSQWWNKERHLPLPLLVLLPLPSPDEDSRTEEVVSSSTIKMEQEEEEEEDEETEVAYSTRNNLFVWENGTH